MSGFNYSKWDNIELSDDESDLHPNIDKESWFRMKHRSRLEREEQEDKEIAHMKKDEKEFHSRLKILNARLKAIENGTAGEDAEFEDLDALKSEQAEIITNLGLMAKRTEEIEERRKWNIDNICKVSEERTIVNNAESTKSLKGEDFAPTGLTEKTIAKNREEKEKKDATKATDAAATVTATATASTTSTTTAEPMVVEKKAAAKAPAVGPKVDEKKEKRGILSYNDYVLGNEQILEDYSEVQDLERTKDFLWKHCDVLMHEHSQSYMLLSCLEDEMNGKRDRMKLVCRQSQILSHVQELGVSMGRDPRDVIIPFFERIGEKQYLTNFLQAVKDFEKRIIDRAVVKRKEMDAERLEEEGIPLGPGGLNPFEVLAELPEELRDAFDSQDVGRLQGVIAAMDPKDASMWMKKCVDSGLWVAGGGDAPDGLQEEEEEAEAAARRERELDPLD
jgi:cell division cycle protein 37